MSFKTTILNTLSRRIPSSTIGRSEVSPASRATQISRAWFVASKRQNSYFQGDSTKFRQPSSNASSGNVSGPIYVIPSEYSAKRYSLSSSLLFGILAGVLSFAILSLSSGFMGEEHGRRSSILARLGYSGTDEDNEDEAEYAEDDGTEAQRDPNKTRDELPAAEILALEKNIVLQKLWNLREKTEKDEESAELRDLLDASNEAQLKVHMALIDLVTNSNSENAILDNALLESRPIVLSDRTRLDPAKASLIRVVDAQGKNKLLILGVDMDWHKSNQESASRFPSDCYELDQWLINLADEFEWAGGNNRDLAIYLYTNRVILDINHMTGNQWMTRYRQYNFPAGFPLAQMRQIKKVSDPNSNISNIVAKRSATGHDREAS